MTIFPRSVWCDRYDPAPTEPRHDPHAPAKKTVVIDRRVTHAGFVEVTGYV